MKPSLEHVGGFRSTKIDQDFETRTLFLETSVLESESLGTAGPKSQKNNWERGAFFKVVTPKGLGPIHLIRLILSNLVEGGIRDDVFILILFDLIERSLRQAERDRNFRKKWRPYLKALMLLSKSLPFLAKNLDSISKVKYIILNRMSQEIDVIKFLIPPQNRKDDPLGEIKVTRHREYQPTPKKSTKIPSNSQGTKGSYHPDSVSWKEVAQGHRVFENGRFIVVPEIPTKNVGEVP